MFRKGWGDDDILAPGEIPVDPALPQLATMLDPRKMETILRRPLPGVHVSGPPDVARCRIANVRYRPGLKCQVSYRLDVRDNSDANSGARFITVSAVNEERTLRRLPRIMKAARHEGVRFDFLPDRRMILTSFPNDLRICQLREVVTCGAFDSALRDTLQRPRASEAGRENGGFMVTVISYRPERSCLIHCEGAATHSPFFARMYVEDRGERVFDAMRALWDSEARCDGRLSMAQPLSYDSETRTLFHGAVPGASLRELGSIDTFVQRSRPIARSLAAIHRCCVTAADARQPDDELRWLTRMAQGLAAVRSDTAGRLGTLLQRLERTAPDPNGATRGLLHGDFSMNQVLLDGPRVSIIDFDDVAVGDTCADLGTFLARLTSRIPDQTTAHSAAEIFRRHYEQAQGVAVQDDRLRWYQALAFVRLGFSALSQLRPGWPQRLDTHWRSAGKLLDGDMP